MEGHATKRPRTEENREEVQFEIKELQKLSHEFVSSIRKLRIRNEPPNMADFVFSAKSVLAFMRSADTLDEDEMPDDYFVGNTLYEGSRHDGGEVSVLKQKVKAELRKLAQDWKISSQLCEIAKVTRRLEPGHRKPCTLYDSALMVWRKITHLRQIYVSPDKQNVFTVGNTPQLPPLTGIDYKSDLQLQVRIFSIPSNKYLSDYRLSCSAVDCVRWSPDSTKVAFGISRAKGFLVWDEWIIDLPPCFMPGDSRVSHLFWISESELMSINIHGRLTLYDRNRRCPQVE